MLVGVLYPSIESYKALKTESKDDDSQVGVRLKVLQASEIRLRTVCNLKRVYH